MGIPATVHSALLLPVLGQGRAVDNGRPFHERDGFSASGCVAVCCGNMM